MRLSTEKEITTDQDFVNEAINPDSLPDGWEADWFEEGWPVAPDGMYRILWPEHVTARVCNSQCTIWKLS